MAPFPQLLPQNQILSAEVFPSNKETIYQHPEASQIHVKIDQSRDSPKELSGDSQILKVSRSGLAE